MASCIKDSIATDLGKLCSGGGQSFAKESSCSIDNLLLLQAPDLFIRDAEKLAKHVLVVLA